MSGYRTRVHGVTPIDGSDLHEFGFTNSDLNGNVLICIDEKDADNCVDFPGDCPPLKKLRAWAVVESFTEWR